MNGMSNPGNYGVYGSVAPGVPVGAQTRPLASSLPPCSRTVPCSKHLFSPTNISHLDKAEPFFSDQGADI